MVIVIKVAKETHIIVKEIYIRKMRQATVRYKQKMVNVLGIYKEVRRNQIKRVKKRQAWFGLWYTQIPLAQEMKRSEL